MLDEVSSGATNAIRRQSIATRTIYNGGSSCQITKYELAEALGLTSDALFVEQIFKIADSNNDGYLSKEEFANVIVVLTKGSSEEKADLMLRIYDADESGTLSWDECNEMLASFLEMNKVNDGNLICIEEATKAIFEKAELQSLKKDGRFLVLLRLQFCLTLSTPKSEYYTTRF